MSSWRDYATLAGQLEAHRGAQATRATGQANARSAAWAELGALETLLAAQRTHITELYDKLDLPDPILTAQSPEVNDLQEALRRARDAAERCTRQLTTIELAAKRSPLLPHWSTNLRNSLVYGCTSAAAFLVNVLVLLSASGVGLVVAALLFVVLPFLAYGIGSSLIGLLFTPALGGKPSKTRPLGLAICLAPVLPLCALWSVPWSAGG